MDSGPEGLKAAAAARALELVESGMVLGLGTGSTVRYFISGLAQLVSTGLRISVLATSEASAQLARAAGIPVLSDLDQRLDLAIDGADEIDPGLNLIKGRGGAMFREKMVAQCSERFVVIADDSKLVSRLGQGALPVEVLPFLWRRTADRLGALGASWELRGGPEHPYRTDNDNLVLDLRFPTGISDARELEREINNIVGVIENGLFVAMATGCIIASANSIRILGSLA